MSNIRLAPCFSALVWALIALTVGGQCHLCAVNGYGGLCATNRRIPKTHHYRGNHLMPVTITLEQLAHHVRIDLSADVDDPTRLILADLLNAATETVEHYAPDAPPSVQNMSVAQYGSCPSRATTTATRFTSA